MHNNVSSKPKHILHLHCDESLHSCSQMSHHRCYMVVQSCGPWHWAMGVCMECREVLVWYHTHMGQDQGPVGCRHWMWEGGGGHALCMLESACVSKRGQSTVQGGWGSMLDLWVPAFGSDFPVNHTEIKGGKGRFSFSELNPSLSTFKTHGKVQ